MPFNPKKGINIELAGKEEQAVALIFLVTPTDRPLLHMRIIGHLAELIEAEEFLGRWEKAENEKDLKNVLLTDERFINVRLQEHTPSEDWINKAIMDVSLPGECLIAIIERDGDIVIPKGKTKLKSGDVLSILGYPKDIEVLKQQLDS